LGVSGLGLYRVLKWNSSKNLTLDQWKLSSIREDPGSERSLPKAAVVAGAVPEGIPKDERAANEESALTANDIAQRD
jgi:hypothetical protein